MAITNSNKFSGPIIHKTRTQAVVDALREKILAGEFKGGEALRQSALAQALNVSRIPVREALLQLEAQGLVKFEAHKGAVVTELSVNEISELLELRALIETDMLARALELMTDEDLDEAEEILLALENMLDTGSEIHNWSELNCRFHMALYLPANRPETLAMIQALHTKSDRYIRLQLLLSGSIPKAESEHRTILQLCRDRNTQDAIESLQEHILAACADIKTFLASQHKKASSSKEEFNLGSFSCD